MLVQVLAFLLVIGIAFYQVTQGLFNALIMTILSVFAAVIAFNFYEPLALTLAEWQPQTAHAIALLALFVIPLLLLRIGFDLLLRNNVVFGMWADRIGGGVLGIITGIILVGMLTTTLQMLPWGWTVLGYEPYDRKLTRDSSLAPFYPDEFVVGMVSMFSEGSLDADKPWDGIHDDLFLELTASRNEVGQYVRVGAPVDSLKVVGAWKADWGQSWTQAVPLPPESADIRGNGNLLVVRVAVAETARDTIPQADNWYRLPATHFRLVGADGQSLFPVAYLTGFSTGSDESRYKDYNEFRGTYTPESWMAHTAPKQEVADKRPDYAELMVARRWWEANGPEMLTVDWVFLVPDDFEPAYVVFRKVSMAEVPKPVAGMPAKGEALARSTRK